MTGVGLGLLGPYPTPLTTKWLSTNDECGASLSLTLGNQDIYLAAIPELLAGTASLADWTKSPLCNWKAPTAPIPGLNTNRELLDRESAISIGVLPDPRSAATACLSDSAPAGDTPYEETVP